MNWHGLPDTAAQLWRPGEMIPAMETMSAAALRTAIEGTGWYPTLVNDTLDLALAGEPVVAFVVQHEPHFDADELRRHVTVSVLTSTRLIVGHADEFGIDETHTQPFATASTESVALSAVRSVVVSRTVSRPHGYQAGDPVDELVMTVGWGAVSRIDLEPAGCGDPECDADHGFTGTASADDLLMRVSSAADGVTVVAQAVRFAAALSAMTSAVTGSTTRTTR